MLQGNSDTLFCHDEYQARSLGEGYVMGHTSNALVSSHLLSGTSWGIVVRQQFYPLSPSLLEG